MAMTGQGAKSLSDTQKQGLEEVLANYDPKNLSDDDAKSLVAQIKDVGLQPGRGLSEALGSVGIDARGLAQQAGLGDQGGPGGGKGGPGGVGGPGGGPGAKGPDSAAVQTLQSVVEQLKASMSDGDSEEDFAALLLQKLEEAGLDTSEPILDFRV